MTPYNSLDTHLRSGRSGGDPEHLQSGLDQPELSQKLCGGGQESNSSSIVSIIITHAFITS
jgi:hypothetical protein